LKVWLGLCLCAGVAVVAAPAAFAQTPTQQGYDESGVIGQFESGDSGSPPPADQSVPTSGAGGAGQGQSGERGETTRSADSGSLPFTGLGLGIVLLMGAVLVGTGVVLRRTARPTQS
jgi:hypothetical protein